MSVKFDYKKHRYTYIFIRRFRNYNYIISYSYKLLSVCCSSISDSFLGTSFRPLGGEDREFVTQFLARFIFGAGKVENALLTFLHVALVKTENLVVSPY